MADLNPNIILQGMDTTHPIQPQPYGEVMEQAARTTNLEASSNLQRQQAADMALNNQLKMQQMQSQQAISASMMQAFAQGRATQQAAVANSAVANTAVGATHLPDDVDPTWSVDKTMDWYRDKDGNPVSHAAGPMFSPSGRPNVYSHEVLQKVADGAIQSGAQPMYVTQWLNDNLDKATAFDKENSTIAKNVSDMAEARARANNLSAQTSVIVMNATRNHADDVMSGSSDPAAQTHNALIQAQQNPGIWGPKLQAAGVDVRTDPQSGLLVANTSDPRFLQVFAGEARLSPNALDRAKLASEAAARGIHVVQGVDANTLLPTQSVVRVDANGAHTLYTAGSIGAPQGPAPAAGSAAAVAPGVVGGTAGQRAATGVPMITLDNGAQVKSSGSTVIDQYAKGVAAYTDNIQTVPMRFRPLVEAEAKQINPDYDQTKYQLKNQARTQFELGKAGTPGGNLVSIDTAINHLELWKEAATAVNAGDLPLVNKIYAQLGKATGNGAITQAQIVSDIAADEVVKAVVGNISGEAERQQMQKLLDARNLSPDQVASNFNEAQGLMAGRLVPLVNTAKNAGLSENDLALSPASRRLLSGEVAHQTQVEAARSAQPLPSKAGDMITDSAGVKWAYKGSGDVKDKNNYLRVQ